MFSYLRENFLDGTPQLSATDNGRISDSGNFYQTPIDYSDGLRVLKSNWQPVELAHAVRTKGSSKVCTVMSERILIARDQEGHLFCMPDACPHKGISLEHGFIETGEITCPFHGWKFDLDGKCIDRPFEGSAPSACNIRTYPVIEKYGLIFVYLGEDVEPTFPSIDILEEPWGNVHARKHLPINCNWVFIQDNAADPTHTEYLHGKMNKKILGHDPTGFSLKMLSYGFLETDFGFIKTWTYADKDGKEYFGFGNALVFPNLLCIESEVQWRVPVDENNTLMFLASVMPQKDADNAERIVDFRDANGAYDLSTPFGQDAMALETSYKSYLEGKPFLLGRSDIGIKLFRDMLDAKIRLLGEASPVDSEDNHCLPVSQFMGGYLPSTGVRRTQSAMNDVQKWRNIINDTYVQINLEKSK